MRLAESDSRRVRICNLFMMKYTEVREKSLVQALGSICIEILEIIKSIPKADTSINSKVISKYLITCSLGD